MSPLASTCVCEEVDGEEAEDEAPPRGCFSSFCTSLCNFEVSEVWVEVVGEDEEGDEVVCLGKGGKGKGNWWEVRWEVDGWLPGRRSAR